ncbi:MAG: hypothetical protein JXB88_09490 [Spirochaetales bacterium]|nr:hypothetical protein [Spirochaetales bacterium]
MKHEKGIQILAYVKTHAPTLNLENVIDFPHGFLRQVKEALPDISDNSEPDIFALITAICWIGPSNTGPLPETIWSTIYDRIVLSIKFDDRIDRVIDFVIAFGCGKWRKVREGTSNSWYHIWPGARKILADIAERAIRKKANPWLKNSVKGFPDMGKADIRHYVHFFIEKLLFPEFTMPVLENESFIIECSDQGATLKKNREIMNMILPGMKYVFSANMEKAEMEIETGKKHISFDYPIVITPGNKKVYILLYENNKKKPFIMNQNELCKLKGPFTLKRWECSCGYIHCGIRHRLSEWKPEIKLKDFVYSALKGVVKEIKTNSFINSMYFPDLAIDVLPTGGRLRFTPIEYKKCNKCDKEYEGETCINEECKRVFDPFRDKRFSKEVIIMLGLHPELYILKERYKCPVCSNMYDIYDNLLKNTVCSFCNTPYIEQSCLDALWKNEQTDLQKVRKLHKILMKTDTCPTCQRPRGEICWCPLGGDKLHTRHSFGCLPQRLVYVYSRVFYKIIAGDMYPYL